MDLNISVRQGVVTGILGPNGSGKSTILRSLSRIMKPKYGRVLLGDCDLYQECSLQESARAIAVVPQSEVNTLDFTVRDVVEMGRAPARERGIFRRMSLSDRDAVESAMLRTGTLELSDRIITTVSGGEAQRVLLARALAQGTDILLLDEPTSHLDLLHQHETLRLVRSLAHDDGKAVVCVLHDLNLASEYCDAIHLLAGGQVIADGLPDVVLTPQNIFQAYAIPVEIEKNRATGRVHIRSKSATRPAFGQDLPRVHVICGGGTGSHLLRELSEGGFDVTVGALNSGDTDLDTAQTLNFICPIESPFSPLSSKTVEMSRQLALESDIIVLAEVPFGPGNVSHLETVEMAAMQRIPILVMQSGDSTDAERDFTNGIAEAKLTRIVADGATVSVAHADISNIIREIANRRRLPSQ